MLSSRRIRRWVGAGAAALTAAGALLLIPGAVPLAHSSDCSDAEVVFARGTDEPRGLGRIGDAFVDSLRQQASGLNITKYGVNYAASKLQLHGGDGANDVINHVKHTVSSCPNTAIVLGGYSQGASVMDIVAGVPVGGVNWGNALPPELANNVAAVVTFGDVADRAGGSLPAQSAMFGSRAIDLCNPNDPICHAGPGNEWKGHTEGYIPVYTTQAAAFVASRLLAGSGRQAPGFGPPQAFGPQVAPGYGPQTPGYGPQAAPGYGPQTPGYGPQTPQYGPQQSPGYGPQAPQTGPQTPGYGPQQAPDNSQQAPQTGPQPPQTGPQPPGYGPQQAPDNSQQAPQAGPQPPQTGPQTPGYGPQQAPDNSQQAPGYAPQTPNYAPPPPGPVPPSGLV